MNSNTKIKLNILIKIILLFLVFLPAIVGIFDKVGYYIFQILLVSSYFFKNNISSRHFKILVSVISIFLFISISDIALRIFFNSNIHYRAQDKFTIFCPDIKDNTKYEKLVYDKRISYGDLAAMSGNKKFREYREIIFKTDEYGFRNDESNKFYDLILLGDSFGEGQGVSQENNIIGLFQKKYNLYGYNLSIPGNSLYNEIMNFKNNISRIKLKDKKLIWLIYLANDLDDTYNDNFDLNLYKKNYYQSIISKIQTFRKKSCIRLFWKYAFRQGKAEKKVIHKKFINDKDILFYKEYVERKNRSLKDLNEHPNSKNFNAAFKEMRKIGQENNFDIIVVLIPDKCEIYHWVLDDLKPWSNLETPTASSIFLKKFCDENEFKFIDSTPELLKQSEILYKNSESLLWWYDDTHLNDTGYQVLTDFMFKNIYKN